MTVKSVTSQVHTGRKHEELPPKIFRINVTNFEVIPIGPFIHIKYITEIMHPGDDEKTKGLISYNIRLPLNEKKKQLVINIYQKYVLYRPNLNCT